MVEQHRMIQVRIESAAAVAARMPSVSGIVKIPRLNGWATKSFDDLLTRIRGEIVKAVTSLDARMSQCEASLRCAIEDADASPLRGLSRVAAVAQACKTWAVEHRADPAALQTLCENPNVQIDGSIASLVIDSSATFGEMGRSRVLAALAERVFEESAALAQPQEVLRVLEAGKDLPWQAPGHEDLARCAVVLDKALYAGPADQRPATPNAGLAGDLQDAVMAYAMHPRIAVLEVVARNTIRVEALTLISARAEELYEIDPRLTHRLVAALAQNPATPPAVLRPLADAKMWTNKAEERASLEALLDRVVGKTPAPASYESPSL